MEKHGMQAAVRDAVAALSEAAPTLDPPPLTTTVPPALRPAPAPTTAPAPPPEVRPGDPLQDWNGWASLSVYAEPEVDAEGYIYADGRTLNPIHAEQMTHAYDVLRTHFHGRRGVTVRMDSNLHYRRDDRRAFLAPDVMVVFGVDEDMSIPSHRAWERGVPSLVLEVLSESTRGNDLGRKARMYERIGIAEYVLYDPSGQWLPGRLRLLGLVDGAYVERPLSAGVAVVDDSGAEQAKARGVHSEALGLDFLDLGGNLRLRDPATGRLLPTSLESKARAVREAKGRRRAEQRLDREAEARRRERQRADSERQRADREAKGRRSERQRADREAKGRRSERQRADSEAAGRRDAEQQLDREAEARRSVEQRLDREAEARRSVEQRLDREAEARRSVEQRLDREAEARRRERQRADSEAAGRLRERQNAEARIAELERQLRERPPGGVTSAPDQVHRPRPGQQDKTPNR